MQQASGVGKSDKTSSAVRAPAAADAARWAASRPAEAHAAGSQAAADLQLGGSSWDRLRLTGSKKRS